MPATPIEQLKREALAMKAVMRDGQWVREPYVLTRSASGLSDRPLNQAAAARVLAAEERACQRS